MREQTKAIRDILKSKFPGVKFMVRYKIANNYVDSSDKVVVVVCDKSVNVFDIISTLHTYTLGIKIGVVDSVLMSSGNTKGKIFSVNDSGCVDADMLEFIEVK